VVTLPTRGLTTTLTARQCEVLTLLAGGHTNSSIAQTLGITLGTVKNHVEAILQRLCADNRRHAVRLAVEAGVLR
jgi:DNA-binding NarL/FixJ family response regulator